MKRRRRERESEKNRRGKKTQEKKRKRMPKRRNIERRTSKKGNSEQGNGKDYSRKGGTGKSNKKKPMEGSPCLLATKDSSYVGRARFASDHYNGSRPDISHTTPEQPQHGRHKGGSLRTVRKQTTYLSARDLPNPPCNGTYTLRGMN